MFDDVVGYAVVDPEAVLRLTADLGEIRKRFRDAELLHRIEALFDAYPRPIVHTWLALLGSAFAQRAQEVEPGMHLLYRRLLQRYGLRVY